MPRIVHIDASDYTRALYGEIENPLPGLEVCVGDPSPDEIVRRVGDSEIILNGHSYMPADVIARLPNLRSIIFLGSGASSYIDIPAAEARGIVVRTIRGYGDRSIAEHAFALLMAAARGVARMDHDVRQGIWKTLDGIELGGKTLGIIGLGGIGEEMCRIAHGFGMRVIAWNRSPVPTSAAREIVTFDEVLARSDAISLHLALTPETTGLIGAREIARMKRGAILVNTARSAIVDESAMIEALNLGHLAHAALDVFLTEPLPQDRPLVQLDNVTLTSHAAWKTRDAARRLLSTAIELARRDSDELARGNALI